MTEKNMGKKKAGEGAKTQQMSRSIKLAEWVSLGLSIGIIGGLASTLLIAAWKSRPVVVFPEIRPRLDQIQGSDGAFVLPVEVRNNENRSISQVKIALHYRQQGEQKKRDYDLDYLTGDAEKTVYFVFSQNPNELGVEASVESYQSE